MLCGYIMLLTLLSQLFNRPNNSQENGHNNGRITIKIVLFCSIPTFFLSSGLTLFLASLSSKDVTCPETYKLIQTFPLDDNMDAEIRIRLPIPDTYLHSLTVKTTNYTVYESNDNICLIKSQIKRCYMNGRIDCKQYKLERDESKTILDLIDRIILC